MYNELSQPPQLQILGHFVALILGLLMYYIMSSAGGVQFCFSFQRDQTHMNNF